MCDVPRSRPGKSRAQADSKDSRRYRDGPTAPTDPFFHREGDDLLCEIPVSYPTLVLGGEIEVPTLTDPTSVKIPRGTHPETRFRLRGKGMPNVGGRGHGDLYVGVKVIIPEKLSREQKTIIENLDQTMPDRVLDPVSTDTNGERPFFERVKDIFG